jgi:hypothetical protein
VGEFDAGGAGPFGGELVVLAGRPAAGVVGLGFPLGGDKALVLEAGEHGVQGPAGELSGLHEVVAVLACGDVDEENPQDPF